MPAAEQRVYALAKAIVRALQPGNGRSSRCETEDELRSRLSEGGVVYDPSDLPAGLSPYWRATGKVVTTRAHCWAWRTYFYGSTQALGWTNREIARNVNEKVPRLAAVGDFIHSASTRFGSGTSSALWH